MFGQPLTGVISWEEHRKELEAAWRKAHGRQRTSRKAGEGQDSVVATPKTGRVSPKASV